VFQGLQHVPALPHHSRKHEDALKQFFCKQKFGSVKKCAAAAVFPIILQVFIIMAKKIHHFML